METIGIIILIINIFVLGICLFEPESFTALHIKNATEYTENLYMVLLYLVISPTVVLATILAETFRLLTIILRNPATKFHKFMLQDPRDLVNFTIEIRRKQNGVVTVDGADYCPDERNCGCGLPDISESRRK